MADEILLLEGLPYSLGHHCEREEDEECVSMEYDALIKNFEIRNYSWFRIILNFALKFNHHLAAWFNFQKFIRITLISHQASASSASVLMTQHFILQLSNIINEKPKHLPWEHEISYL